MSVGFASVKATTVVGNKDHHRLVQNSQERLLGRPDWWGVSGPRTVAGSGLLTFLGVEVTAKG